MKSCMWRSGWNEKSMSATMHSPNLYSLLTLFIVLVHQLAIVDGSYCPSDCKCDDETLMVNCNEGHLDVLPIALNPSIQRLVIKNNKIKTIDSSIQFYSELTFLDLSYNHLVHIPERTFQYQKKLQELHLNHNKIGAISNKTLTGLTSLTVLNLRGNFLDTLDDEVFVQLVKLEELNLGANRITKIAPNAFKGLTNLRLLYLDDNILTLMPIIALKAMFSLAEFYAGTNSFTTIPKDAFSEMHGLTKLELKGAGLKNISEGSFEGLENLRILDLSDNRLDKIPTEEMSSLTRLEDLFLGQNEFTVIKEDAFKGLNNLKTLEVTGAVNLKTVEKGAFNTNTNLETLNLSSNKKLEEIQEGALSGLPHLKTVILRENALTSLPEGMFPWGELKILDISSNTFHCDCKILWLKNLVVSKNATNEGLDNILCSSPQILKDQPLRSVSADVLGCDHSDPHKQAIIAAALVGIAASITALVLLLFHCRKRIREALKGGWGNSALGRKEREYQKTFHEDDYMTRFNQNSCSLVHPNQFNYTNGQNVRPIPVTEL